MLLVFTTNLIIIYYRYYHRTSFIHKTEGYEMHITEWNEVA